MERTGGLRRQVPQLFRMMDLSVTQAPGTAQQRGSLLALRLTHKTRTHDMPGCSSPSFFSHLAQSSPKTVWMITWRTILSV